MACFDNAVTGSSACLQCPYSTQWGLLINVLIDCQLSNLIKFLFWINLEKYYKQWRGFDDFKNINVFLYILFMNNYLICRR